MGMAHIRAVQHARRLKGTGKVKDLLLECAYWERNDGQQPFCSNKLLASSCQVEIRQVSNIKRRAENLGFVTFHTQQGRGKAQHFTLHMDAITDGTWTEEQIAKVARAAKTVKHAKNLSKTCNIPHQNMHTVLLPIPKGISIQTCARGAPAIIEGSPKGSHDEEVNGLWAVQHDFDWMPQAAWEDAVEACPNPNIWLDLIAYNEPDEIFSWFKGCAWLSQRDGRHALIEPKAFRRAKLKEKFSKWLAHHQIKVLSHMTEARA